MAGHPLRLHLFQGYGVELEYMIVDRRTLDVRPYSDKVLRDEVGAIKEEIENGETCWSNELVSHVIELKSNGPKSDLKALHGHFQSSIRDLNRKLAQHGSQLLPTGMHPWMNPLRETVLWQHGSNEIYALYDSIFNCKGHGWSNLQSVHINLPFYDDEEFGRLHTAIRFLLPLIPIITASSPVMEGKVTGIADNRLDTYERNQARIPILTARVIPEAVFSKYGYQKAIYDKIATAIAPFDPESIMNPVWLNSRGAIARFDRGAIEIRIIDIQECPKADLALVALIVNTLKILVSGRSVPFEVQKEFDTNDLYKIYRKTLKSGTQTSFEESSYMRALGLEGEQTGSAVWRHLIGLIDKEASAELDFWRAEIDMILEKGNLAERILKAINGEPTPQRLHQIYGKLAECLENDTQFVHD